MIILKNYKEICPHSFIKGNCYTNDGTDTAWFEHEVRASFPGGKDSLIKFIMKNLRYPSAAKSEGIEGTVYVAFTITKQGEVIDVFIRKGVHPYLDKEAILLMSKMPKWIPARQEDRTLKSMYTLPITFSWGPIEKGLQQITAYKFTYQVSCYKLLLAVFCF